MLLHPLSSAMVRGVREVRGVRGVRGCAVQRMYVGPNFSSAILR